MPWRLWLFWIQYFEHSVVHETTVVFSQAKSVVHKDESSIGDNGSVGSKFYSFDLLYDLGFYLFILDLDLTLGFVSFTLRLPKVCLLFFYLNVLVLSIFVIVACHMFGEIPLDMCCVIMCFKFFVIFLFPALCKSASSGVWSGLIDSHMVDFGLPSESQIGWRMNCWHKGCVLGIIMLRKMLCISEVLVLCATQFSNILPLVFFLKDVQQKWKLYFVVNLSHSSIIPDDAKWRHHCHYLCPNLLWFVTEIP